MPGTKYIFHQRQDPFRKTEGGWFTDKTFDLFSEGITFIF